MHKSKISALRKTRTVWKDWSAYAIANGSVNELHWKTVCWFMKMLHIHVEMTVRAGVLIREPSSPRDKQCAFPSVVLYLVLPTLGMWDSHHRRWTDVQQVTDTVFIRYHFHNYASSQTAKHNMHLLVAFYKTRWGTGSQWDIYNHILNNSLQGVCRSIHLQNFRKI